MTALTLSTPASAVSSSPIKACRVHRFGPPEVITLEDIGKPRAERGRGSGPGQGGRRRSLGRLDPGGQERPAAAPALDARIRSFGHRWRPSARR